MILKTIEIQGFKSFADKTVLQFGKGVTAVVGPNGSGKSNISDAVRWVLGEQSTKNLRGQSMEDVIFGGTVTRRPQGFAEVTLTIDNSDRSLNFDSDTVAVTRRYYRSHESEYLINKAIVRLKDVNELFMDTGVGRDGYSMIGQGKIDSIVSSRSDERREMFEEAAGISKYRYRKTEAQRKLSQADDNLVRLNDIADELKNRVGPLKSQSEKAAKFLELSEQKKELDIGIWLYNLDRHNELLREQEHKIMLAKNQYAELENQLSSMAENIEKSSADSTKITENIEQIRLKRSSLEESITRINGEIALLKNSAEHNRESAENMTAEIADIENSGAAAEEEIKKYQESAELKNAAAARIDDEIKGLETSFNELLLSSENISNEIENLMKKLSEISAALSENEVATVTARSSAAEIEQRRKNITSALTAGENERSRLEKEMEELDKALKSADEIISDCKNSLDGYKKLHGIKAAALEEKKTAAETARLDTEAKRRRIAILSDLQKNMDGFNHSVKAVIKDAEKGILRGVIGTVNTVITVKKEHIGAIEVALGNALQDIVVETEEDAKRAINYLKKGSRGRATFLPVSSIIGKTLDEYDIKEAYGYIAPACDLVECDKKYREIIKSLLGRIAVTEDLDSAVAMAKKNKYKFKVVTLDGQVVNAGGSLTGGSLIKNAGILGREGEIKRLTDELSKDEKKYNELTSALEAAKSDLAKLDAAITAANAELANSQEDKIRVLGEIKRVGEQQKFNEKSLSELKNEDAALGTRLSDLQQKMSDNGGVAQKLLSDKSSVQTEIEKMTAGRDDITAKREELNKKVTELRLQSVTAKKDAEAIALTVKNIRAAADGRAERIESLKSAIAELETKNTELDAVIAAKNGDIELNRRNAELLEHDVEEMQKHREELEANARKLRDGEREKVLDREKLSKEVARLEERRENMLRDYDEIIKKLFDEYELTRAEAEKTGIKIDGISEARRSLAEIKGKIKALGTVNVAAIEEYKEVSERYGFMKDQIDDIEKSRRELSKLINGLTEQMKQKFADGFAKISADFSKTFSELFGGGKGELALTDPENILESGIEINVKLPGKNVPSIDALSGGEKALIAIAIYFSIMRVSPPPFCFLDEVDTALDDINVERFADYMHRSEFGTQFICVTHRRGTMEAADMLYGVTMQEKGVTKLLQLNVEELVRTLNLSNN